MILSSRCAAPIGFHSVPSVWVERQWEALSKTCFVSSLANRRLILELYSQEFFLKLPMDKPIFFRQDGTYHLFCMATTPSHRIVRTCMIYYHTGPKSECHLPHSGISPVFPRCLQCGLEMQSSLGLSGQRLLVLTS